MNAKLSKTALNKLAADNMIAYINSHAILQALPAKQDKNASGLPIVLLAPTREQALNLFNIAKSQLNFVNVPGEAGLLQNTNDNIAMFFDRVNNKGQKIGVARVADLRDAKNEYILVTIMTNDFSQLGKELDPAVTFLRGLADIGGTVKPYEDKTHIGAVVEFPKSFAGADSPYAMNVGRPQRLFAVQKIEELAGLKPGSYTSNYKDSFNLAGFYAANPGTPKWMVVRRK